MEKVRVLRVIEYVGSRCVVEETVQRSIHGAKTVTKDLTIRVTTIGEFPELLDGDDGDEGKV